MADLHISTLGALQITSNHTPISGFLSDKVRALLVYLAVEQPRPFTRSALAGLFWPGQPERKARANLRRALANLRQVIDDEHGRYLTISHQTLQFNSDSSAFVDAVAFRQLLSVEPTLAQMEEAAALAHGRFLDGFALSDSIAFEEWALLQRESVQRRLLHLLNRLAAYYEAHHQPETAVGYAWRQVNLEPWFEPGQRQLLRLLAQTGERTAALAHYEQFAAELAAELNIAPELETQQLYEEIRNARQTNRLLPPPFLAEPPLPAAQFVAREVELDRLHHFLDTAVAGHGHMVFITGEAASGKTALLQKFARQAQHRHPRLIPLFGACPIKKGPGIPYALLGTILARVLGDVESLWRSGAMNRAQIARLWSLRQPALALLQDTAPDCLGALVEPTLRPPAVNDTAAPSEEILWRQLAHFLQQFSQHGPLLLLLDDLHWIDDSSLDFLLYLRSHLTGFPILLVGAYRPEELRPPLPPAVRHPLAQLVYELAGHNGNIEVSLDRADGRGFINAWLDTEPNRLDDAFRQTLYNQTRGHALFTVALVSKLKELGKLKRDIQGYWQAERIFCWRTLPARTEAIIAERIDRLPETMRRLLAAASVQGETFLVEVVARVLNCSLHDVITPLSTSLARHHQLVQAEGRQQLGSIGVYRYRFRHQLFQQYVYDQLDPVEQAHLHQQTGAALVQLHQLAELAPGAAAAELAHHFEAAQDWRQAVHYHQEAGRNALRLSAQQAAIDHYRRGLDLLHRQPDNEANILQEIEMQLALGAALLTVEGYGSPAVKAVYDRAHSLCRRVGPDGLPQLVTTLSWLASYYAVSGDLPQARAVSAQMLAIMDEAEIDDLARILAHVLVGLTLFFLGNNEAALTHFKQASALYDPPRHQPLVYAFGQDPGISAMLWQGHVLLHMGRFRQARRCLQQALVWSQTLDHPYTEVFARLLAGGTPNNGWYLWQPEEAMDQITTAVTLAEQEGFVQMTALGNFYLGHITAVTNPAEMEAGLAMMAAALEQEARLGSSLGRSSRYLLRAYIYWQCGRMEAAWQALQQADSDATERQELYFEAEILRIRGELQRQTGDDAGAEASWRAAIASARRQQARLWELRATTALCGLWQAQGHVAPARHKLAEVCAHFEGEFESVDVAAARRLLAALG